MINFIGLTRSFTLPDLMHTKKFRKKSYGRVRLTVASRRPFALLSKVTSAPFVSWSVRDGLAK